MHIQRTFGKDENGNDLMTPPWVCYWYGLDNIEVAAKQGMNSSWSTNRTA